MSHEGGVTVIHGGATGADSAAGGIATGLGLVERCYFADWKKHGKKAGPLRNQEMIDDGKPDMVIAFWDAMSRGTLDMITRAKRAGLPVEVVYSDGFHDCPSCRCHTNGRACCDAPWGASEKRQTHQQSEGGKP